MRLARIPFRLPQVLWQQAVVVLHDHQLEALFHVVDTAHHAGHEFSVHHHELRGQASHAVVAGSEFGRDHGTRVGRVVDDRQH